MAVLIIVVVGIISCSSGSSRSNSNRKVAGKQKKVGAIWRDVVTLVTCDASSDRSLPRLPGAIASLTSARTSRFMI
eukprot:1775905-Pyramimonas_sp.AAC.1